MRRVRVTVDRFEGNWAVLLVGSGEARVNWPSRDLPPGVREGSVMWVDFRLDEDETGAARGRVSALIEKLRQRED